MKLHPGVALLVSALAVAYPVQAGFVDVLAQPSVMSPLAAKSPLQAVARAGNRLVAVGQRGHIVVSSDGGKTWTQSPVPVSSDLTALWFANERKGWAVGHDGVVLATSDGGATWALQLDGPRANAAILADVERKAAAAPGSEPLKALLAEAKRNVEQGADKPFLDVWFADEKVGYVVGAYNLAFRTDDGGATWTPWFDRIDNLKFLNLYAIRPAADGLYIVGEAGLVLKLDAAAQRFRAQDSGYNGSFFGVIGNASVVLAYGLRGSVYRSADGGATWERIETGLLASIVGATRTAQGAIVLADAGGRAAISHDGGQTFARLEIAPSMPLAGIAALGEGKYALTGTRGVAVGTAAR